MQCGDLDGPHRCRTNPREHSGPPNHRDDHSVDDGTPSKNGAPPRSTASLSGGATSAISRSVDRHQVALNTQMTELHRRKAALGMERSTTIDYTKERARARAVVINHEGTPPPPFPGPART
jgi:hypothetical protein